MFVPFHCTDFRNCDIVMTVNINRSRQQVYFGLAFTNAPLWSISARTRSDGHERSTCGKTKLGARTYHGKFQKFLMGRRARVRWERQPAMISETEPMLPESSYVALKASILLAAGALGIPTILAISEALSSNEDAISHLSHYSSHFVGVGLTLGFGVLHSGLASLRPFITPRIGERLYRVIFALSSIPSAVLVITYFLIHRYDGVLFLMPYLQSIPWMHSFVYTVTFVSFLFLYPATFNLLEVAAVQKPTVRIYERGITRITRHPQLTGQILWCVAHMLWIGSSFTLSVSLALVAHHAFGAFNGDRRLRDRFGEEWMRYAERTSIVPFAAVLNGRQSIRWREFATPAYVGVVAATLGFYAAHPAVLSAIGHLNWK